MTAFADRYRRLAEGFTARVAAVPSDDARWGNQSPCDDWKALDVVEHMVGTHQMFFGFIDHAVPPGPPVADDPLAAWAHSRDAMQAALDDPAVAAQEFDGMFGRRPWQEAVDQFISGDVLVHTWDLATALGVDARLPEDEVAKARAGLDGLGEHMRGPGVFGPEVEPPADADEQDLLLAFVGRDPRFGR